MSNFLSLEEAIQFSEVAAADFYQKYIEAGVISVQVENGVKRIELSEFLRVFPYASLKAKATPQELEVETILQKQKIEGLERQIAQLQRQLDKQFDEYDWLRTKFDNTTLLLEQKLDTSELDKYKQEIRQLSQHALQWEKKYNTLLAANELKTLLKENRELKQQMEANARETIAAVRAEQQLFSEQAPAAVRTQTTQQVAQPRQQAVASQNPNPASPKRRKLFGIF